MRKSYNEIIGITKNNTLVILEDIFDNGSFKGATRYEMGVLTEGEIGERKNDDYSDLWREVVSAGQTELGLEEWTEMLWDDLAEDEYFPYDDPSFREETQTAWEKLPALAQRTLEDIVGVKGKDFVDWDCVACGRCGVLKKDDFLAILRPDLFELVNKVEKD